MCMPVHTLCGGQRVALAIIPQAPPPCLFEGESVIGSQGFPMLAVWLAGHRAPGVFLSLLHQCCNGTRAPLHPAFYVGAGDHAEASFLPSEHFTNCHSQSP